MAGTPAEKLIAYELLGMMTMTTVNGLRQGDMPGPSAYVGGLILYGLLSAVALFGEGPARVAAGIGGLALLAQLVAPVVTPTHVGTSGTDLFETLAALGNELGSAPRTTSPGITS